MKAESFNQVACSPLRSSENNFQILNNPLIRTISGITMIACFMTIIKMGPAAIFLCNLLFITKSFDELLNIGLKTYQCSSIRKAFTLSWFLFVVSTYALVGQSIYDEFTLDLQNHLILRPIIKYHGIMCFSVYTLGLVIFLANLNNSNYLNMYSMIGFVHVCIAILIIPFSMSIKYFSKGIIRFLFPLITVIFNDIAAYVIGSVCGRHKLIGLSPKKTWEGFIGALILSPIFGYSLSSFMCKFDYFLCPIKYESNQNWFVIDQCQKDLIFHPKEHRLTENIKISIEPFQFHAFVLSILASTLGPLGGFIASGFKRACGIKDFGNTIPGHGGVLDRLDSQFLFQVFVYFYVDCIINETIENVNYTSTFNEQRGEKKEFFKLLHSQLDVPIDINKICK